MRGHRWHAIAGLTALFVCALIAAGCGDDDDTTTATSGGGNAEQNIDAAVKSCNDEAQQLEGAAGTALGTACTSVGNSAKQALSSGSSNVNQALSQVESSCKSEVSKLPSGQDQDSLSMLCDAISSAE